MFQPKSNMKKVMDLEEEKVGIYNMAYVTWFIMNRFGYREPLCNVTVKNMLSNVFQKLNNFECYTILMKARIEAAARRAAEMERQKLKGTLGYTTFDK